MYIFDGKTIRVVKKSNGKKIWTSKKGVAAGYKVKFDSKDNLYVIGYFDLHLVKISKKGKCMWRRDITKTGNYWPSKISVGKTNVKVTCDMNNNDEYGHEKHAVYVNAKTGKIVKSY